MIRKLPTYNDCAKLPIANRCFELQNLGTLPPMRRLFPLIFTFAACQDYPFEARPTLRVEAKKISEVVAVAKPVDILFVVDNSGSMQNEINELRANVSLFIDALSTSDTDFQVGIVTTDIECNIPTKDCSASGLTSTACCNTNPSPCSDNDTNADGKVDISTCDGGRLRAATTNPARRIFTRPSAAERTQWVADIQSILTEVGCNGSGFESGLEAARRAVACATGVGCDDPAVAQLNDGFIRDNADLVIIFLADEDDCSVNDPQVYLQPSPTSDPLEQAVHFCSPHECYAYYGANLDADLDGLQDWVDPDSTPDTLKRLRCGTNNRLENPPDLTPVGFYVSDLIAAKGNDVSQVRAAGILSAVADSGATLGYEGAACVKAAVGPSAACGCLSDAVPFYCNVTSILGQGDIAYPNTASAGVCGVAGGSSSPGCEAMPGNRYMQFLEDLAGRRTAAGVSRDTLVDSICRNRYDQTMDAIVNNVILTSCFDLGEVPASSSDLQVKLNGKTLANVSPNSTTPGWSLASGSTQICLEGGLKKNIGDNFEIFLLKAQD